MAAQIYKSLSPSSDIVTQNFASANALITITSSSQAVLNNTTLFKAAPYTASYINIPDSFGSTTAGLTPSGAVNSVAKFFFNRYSDPYYNSASGVYTIPNASTVGANVSSFIVIEISDPTRSHGLWADSITCCLSYNGTTLTASDDSSQSFGPNPESLSYSPLCDVTNQSNVVGTVFYDYGLILLHGGTGAASASYNANVPNVGWASSITGALTASTSASTVVIESLNYQTYTMLARNLYFCRALNGEFNYTSNPSAAFVPFLQADSQNATVFITTVGLYDSLNRLLAVGKVSPPIKKNQFTEVTLVVSLSV